MAHLCLSLCSLLRADPDRTVLSCDGRSTTTTLLCVQVARLSRGLSTVLDVYQGDRVVLLGLNTDKFFSSLLAVLDAGAVACPLNWRWSKAELAAALYLLQPKVLLVDDHCMPLAQQACSNGGTGQWRIVSMSAANSDQQLQHQQQQHLQGHAAAPATPPQLQLLCPGQGQPALIVFTSGTTGASKGVMLSHNSLIHQSMAKLAIVQYNSSDTYLHMAPLFHIGGLSSAFAVLLAGGAHVFLPRYTPAAALQLIQQHSVTSLIAVPAMMQDLTQAAAAAVAGANAPVPQQQQQQLPSLQRVLVGAGGMSLQLQRAVERLFPRADLQTAYGMTEAASSITFITVKQQQQLMAAATAAALRRQQQQHQSGAAGSADAAPSAAGIGVCVGKPAPGIAVRINHTAATSDNGSSSSTHSRGSQMPLQRQQQWQHTSSASEQPQQQWDAEVGVVGEVCTRGPHVMLGYWADPAATSRVLDSQGWLHTGDLGYLDSSGHLWLVGRLKDMVKSGGENILAAEVEALLLSHPAVAAAAVFGLPHDRLGEQVAAAVVLLPGWGWEDASSVLLPLQHVVAPATAATHQQQQPQQKQQQPPQQPQQQRVQGVVSAVSLQQHCRSSQLSPYKLPRVIVCTQQLPLNSSGKVVKALLKQQVQQLLQAHGSAAGAAGNSSSDGSSDRQQLRSRL